MGSSRGCALISKPREPAGSPGKRRHASTQKSREAKPPNGEHDKKDMTRPAIDDRAHPVRTARRGCISLRARDATTRVRHAQARQQAGRADGAQASRGYVRVRLRSTFRHPFVRVPREKRPPRSAPTVEPDAHSRTPQVRSRRRPLGRSQEERPRRRRRRALVHGTQAGAFRPAMSSASFRRPPDQRKNAPATPARVPAALTRPPPDRAAPLPRASRASASLRRRRAWSASSSA